MGKSSLVIRELGTRDMTNIEVIQELYRAFREEDYGAFTDICTTDIEWIQNEGFPSGATYRGASSVVEGVFKAFNYDWEYFSFDIEQYLDAGDSIIVIGSYVGKHRKSTKLVRAGTAHVFELHDGKVLRFRQFTDTKVIWDAMS